VADSNDKDLPVQELDLAASKREFIETFFKRGAEFTEELMRENERLRYRLVQVEEMNRVLGQGLEKDGSPGGSAKALRELVDRIERLEGERSQLLHRYEGVAKDSADFHARYADIERENNNLANLYVASYQLHSTMELREVTQIIVEILLNFIGAKTFAIQLVDEEKRVLRTLAAEGVARKDVPTPSVSDGVVGTVLSSGKPYFDEARFSARADFAHPVIVAPLCIAQRVVGVVVVWDLLQQKTGLADVDYELFNLLGAHAAAALQGAKLTAELSDRPPQLWAAVDLV